MSATFDEQSLADYFDTTAVLKIPGRHFPVEERVAKDLLQELFYTTILLVKIFLLFFLASQRYWL